MKINLSLLNLIFLTSAFSADIQAPNEGPETKKQKTSANGHHLPSDLGNSTASRELDGSGSQNYQVGLEYVTNKNYTRASELFERALNDVSLTPDKKARTYYFIGCFHTIKKDDTNAFKSFKNALNFPELGGSLKAVILYHFGRVYFANDQFNETIEALETLKALGALGDSCLNTLDTSRKEKALYRLGMAYMKNANYTDADKTFKEAFAIKDLSDEYKQKILASCAECIIDVTPKQLEPRAYNADSTNTSRDEKSSCSTTPEPEDSQKQTTENLEFADIDWKSDLKEFNWKPALEEIDCKSDLEEIDWESDLEESEWKFDPERTDWKYEDNSILSVIAP